MKSRPEDGMIVVLNAKGNTTIKQHHIQGGEMAKYTKSDIIKLVKDRKVKFIRLWFTDVLGFLKGFAITPSELEGALEDGMGFDGSSIEGFARIEESDMIARPDLSTFEILPWRSGENFNVARMFCDIYEPSGKPYEGDPRFVLKRNLAKAKELGYTYYVGPELEYFYFKDSQNPVPLDQGGYFDLVPLDVAQDLRRDTIMTMQALGIAVEYSHHEVAMSQHEIDLRYADALTMADNVMTYRLVVKEIARKHGVYATFMPKPIFGINGSGMHVHQSLFKGSKNAFFDPKDKFHLSEECKAYTAGLLTHAREITSITSQWVNSYKRLVPGYEAPVYICWAQMNRSALIRVPMYKPGKEKATRIEYRSPDPACNPYLAFSAMLSAGLEGIKKKYKLPHPANDNIYHMTIKEREHGGIRSLPDDLYEAINLTENSQLVKESLGNKVFEYFIRNKKMEWDEYKAQVTQYEVNKYLPIL
jgi:glutamine synthetase